MKRNTYLLLLVFISQLLVAQHKKTMKADQLFADKAFVDAAALYEKLEPNQEILQNLGDCYYYNNAMSLAEKQYAKLVYTYGESINKEYYFRYAAALNALNNSDLADEMMSKYTGHKVDTRKFKQHLDSIVPYNYTVKKMSKDGDGDFGVSVFGDKIIYASSQNTSNPTYKWTGRPYLDLFEATVSAEGTLENVKLFSKKVNTKTHESSAVFTKDHKTMYFNRTSERRTEVNGQFYATVKIFRAQFENNEWTNSTEMPFSSDQYSTQHPCLSPDERRIYFSSDRPDSFGSFDLYYVEINEDGTYGEPVNLGEKINTKHREQFPYIDKNNSLYFASNGHQGLGGLDVFRSRLQNGSFAKPINLGTTLNTGADDFSFVLTEADNRGYFSSNRNGSDNIYSFVRVENERKFTIQGYVTDKKTKDLLPNSVVSLYDDADKLVRQITVGLDANYIFNSEPNKKYKIVAERDFYSTKMLEIETNNEGLVRYNIELEIESYVDTEETIVKKDDDLVYIELANIYFDYDKWEIKREAGLVLQDLVDVMKKHPKMEVNLFAHTDTRGSEMYNLTLSQNRANSVLEYLFANGIDKNRLNAEGLGAQKPLINCGENCSETEHATNRRCEFVIVK